MELNPTNISVIQGYTPANIRIGMGFNYNNIGLNRQVLDFPYNLISNNRVARSKVIYTLVSDRSSFRRSLAINTSFGYRKLGNSIEAGFGIKYEDVTDEESITICLSVFSTDTIDTIAPRTALEQFLNPIAVKANKKDRKFSDNWGTHYISSICYGTQLHIFLKISGMSKNSIDHLNASASGHFNGFKSSLSFTKELSIAIENQQVDMIINCNGINFHDRKLYPLISIKPDADLDDYFKTTLDNFLQSSVKDPVPISYTVSPLDGILDKIDKIVLDIDEPILSTYINAYNTYEGYRENIKTIIQKSFALDITQSEIQHLHDLDIYYTEKLTEIAKINNECLKNANCKAYRTENVTDKIYLVNYYKINPIKEWKISFSNPTIEQKYLINKLYYIPLERFKYVENKRIKVAISFDIQGSNDDCNSLAYSLNLNIWDHNFSNNGSNPIMIENKTGIGKNKFHWQDEYSIERLTSRKIHVLLSNGLSLCASPAAGYEKYPIIATNINITYTLESTDSSMLI